MLYSGQSGTIKKCLSLINVTDNAGFGKVWLTRRPFAALLAKLIYLSKLILSSIQSTIDHDSINQKKNSMCTTFLVFWPVHVSLSQQHICSSSFSPPPPPPPFRFTIIPHLTLQSEALFQILVHWLLCLCHQNSTTYPHRVAVYQGIL